MVKRNWDNGTGGCCLDASENKRLRREWKSYIKIYDKLIKKLAKLRGAETKEELAHVIWDINWRLSDDECECTEYWLDTYDCQEEFDKIQTTHEKYIAKIKMEKGYHLDEYGRWVK